MMQAHIFEIITLCVEGPWKGAHPERSTPLALALFGLMNIMPLFRHAAPREIGSQKAVWRAQVGKHPAAVPRGGPNHYLQRRGWLE